MRLLLLLFIMITAIACNDYKYDLCKLPHCEIKSKNLVDVNTKVDTFQSKLIKALIFVESSNNDSAYCKREDAVGCLQIRPIMLNECNRILELQKSTKRYTLVDRWDRGKSIEIFTIVNKYHNKDESYEAIARFWNGGPAWSKKNGTKRYWNKVKRKLNKLSKEDEKRSSDRFAEL